MNSGGRGNPANRAVLALAIALLALVFVRTAWLCDDAYITLRTVDKWNIPRYGPWEPSTYERWLDHAQTLATGDVHADAVEMAGPGELVFIVGAREAAEAMPNRFVPVDHAIVGIVDAVEELGR